jgi:dimeric dUTPase (all-alpha-NTP-PPase superfamily)
MASSLNDMFQKCFRLQVVHGNQERILTQEFRNEMALALQAEIFEALGETPWKPWKKKQKFHIHKFKEELVDCQFFLINLMLSADMSSDQMYDMFCGKYKVNIERQKNGY